MKTVSDNVVLAYLFTGIYLLWKVNVKFCYNKFYCYNKLYHLLLFRLFFIVGISGAVRRDKLTKMSVDDIHDMLLDISHFDR
jgi:hypothetical protein